MEKSDEALIIAHTQGDQHAFGELVGRHTMSLMSYLWRVTGNRQQAEDVFQETFLRVHRGAGRFRPGSSFKPWLFTIATRVAIDGIRHDSRRPMSTQVSHDRADRIEQSDPAPDPRLAASISEQKQAVQRAISSLAPRQRVALILSYYDGLSYPNIADIMKCSVGTVKTHMARALRTLARLLPEPQDGKA
jgi:RNA polymerase sigma-70 factor (ECF subfamily)